MAAKTKPKHAAGANAALYKALGHSLRYRIMVLLTETEASPSEIAERLEEGFDNTAYQVRALAAIGCIALVRKETRRGGTAHIYKAVARPILDTESWEKLPLLEREIRSASDMQLLLGDAIEAIRAGTFDARLARTMLRIPAVLDDEGLSEVESAAAAFLDAALTAQANSSERLAESGEEGFKASVGALAFELPSRPRGEGDR